MDLDSGKYGQIEYRFIKDDVGVTNFFYIEPISGLIRTTSTFDNVHESSLPFRLIVEARDNPKGPDDESKKAEAHVVVSTLKILFKREGMQRKFLKVHTSFIFFASLTLCKYFCNILTSIYI